MSEQIDWSKAPEGATHYSVKYGCFFRESADKDLWIEVTGGCAVGNNGKFIERPATPSWAGEGLPPAGVVCEVIDGLSNEFTKQFNGKQVEIVAHSKDENYETAVFKVIGFLYDGQARYHSLVASCFKPIRTPEQIAADEREEFARNLMLEMGKDSYSSPNALSQARKMYDLGYRKP